MKIIALEKPVPGTAAEAFQPLLNAEAGQIWLLHQSGVVREIYFQHRQCLAVLIMECEDEERARQYLSSLPLVQAGLIDFDLIPLQAYDGFARLFASTLN